VPELELSVEQGLVSAHGERHGATGSTAFLFSFYDGWICQRATYIACLFT
jgi:hypothetical protein